ncbi:MAG: penicillin-binding transpeptidase domain-containing protein [Candidatus Campbellbacteria bacterium]|nr:penicillin-binding transpeptidase domain-containing protein [Candidatus Campbellbacteria bacterium]
MKKENNDIEIEEIIQDAINLPKFLDKEDEGHIVSIVPQKAIVITGLLIFLLLFLFIGRTFFLQIVNGSVYADISRKNSFNKEIIFQKRGIIYDRNGERIGWNSKNEEEDFPYRKYTDKNGMAHLIGFVSYPQKDDKGFYFRESIEGIDGVEELFNDHLSGRAGSIIVEKNAKGDTLSKHILDNPVNGKDIELSVDSDISDFLYNKMEMTAEERGFQGGSALLMSLETGELLALVNYPEYAQEEIASGNEEEIEKFLKDDKSPFFNRAISGLYSPGSTIKPFVAFGVLEEDIISPHKIINVTGSIEIQNPYNKELKSVFHDWKPHGPVDFVRALAVSSNIYFYQIGGGFETQKGLGIKKIEEYLRKFQIGASTDTGLAYEPDGVIPTPEWKEEVFNDPWRVGDTYNTVVGQYGFEVTPLQMIRSISGIAKGSVVTPTITKPDEVSERAIELKDDDSFDLVREGMRQAVLSGTAKGLNVPYVDIAAKTGTAEIGVKKDLVNSWAIGFFPYEEPKYVFAVVMERGPVENTIGGVFVARGMFDWMAENKRELLQ